LGGFRWLFSKQNRQRESLPFAEWREYTDIGPRVNVYNGFEVYGLDELAKT